MNVSVVVIAKNEEKFIGKCLAALSNQTVKPEIIVVDGHSTDRTVKIAKKYADKVVEDNGTGVAEARNIGWKIAKNEVIAYCDADSIPPSDWVEKIAALIGDSICIGGPLKTYDGDTLMRVYYKFWTNYATRFFGKIGLQYLWGPNMAIRKSVLKRYPFRTNILEDYDLSRRLRYAGKMKFTSKICMPVSSRRLKYGFHISVLKFYARNFFRLWFGFQEKDKAYWKQRV